MFAFELDVSGGLRALKATSDEARKAIPRALNRTATTVMARGARAVRDVGYNMKIADIKKAMTATKSTGVETTIAITARGKPLPLIYFSPSGGGPASTFRQGGLVKKQRQPRPIRVRIKGGTVVLNHAFFATTANGHKGIFSRDVKGTISKRLPIAEMFGPSIRAAIENADVVAIMEAAAREAFAKNIEHEMDYVVSKRT